MKIVVVGNCQARPLGRHFEALPYVSEVESIIVHLAKQDDQDANLELMANADLILAQSTADSFKPSHLSSGFIQSEFKERVVTWPNLFFAGQQPNLRYITFAGGARMLGPLEGYHFISGFKAWAAERGLESRLNLGDVPSDDAIALASLDALIAREAHCDTGVSDIVGEEWRKRELFFTFNHPNSWLLARLAERIMAHTGESHTFDPRIFGEKLDRVVLPSTWMPDPPIIKGTQYTKLEGGWIKSGPPQWYTPEAIKRSFVEVYDHYLEHRREFSVRLTPDYSKHFA